MNSAYRQNRQAAGVDWQAIWQDSCRRRKADRNDREFWNKRALAFADHARKTRYVDEFLRLMAPRPHWRVLDVGCGAGTLALPLARMVRAVTAIDFSEVMIDILAERCRHESIVNVSAQVLDWQEDWHGAGIEPHDVVIASRSLVIPDLRGALTKLNAYARHRVFVSSLVGDGPFDRRIFEAIGRELDRGPDYICVYNLLYQMGILADVTFVANDGEAPVSSDLHKVYADLEAAVEGFRWMIDGMTAEEEARLRIYLERHLVKKSGGYALSYHHPVRWAVISWSKT